MKIQLERFKELLRSFFFFFFLSPKCTTVWKESSYRRQTLKWLVSLKKTNNSHHTCTDRFLATSETRSLLTLCPLASHTFLSEETVDFASWHAHLNVRPISFCALEAWSQFPSLFAIHPLSFHNTHPLMVNISDPDDTEKHQQH